MNRGFFFWRWLPKRPFLRSSLPFPITFLSRQLATFISMNASNNHFPCPHCSNSATKAGRNLSGSQSYRCRQCGRKFTPKPRPNGYPKEMRDRAIARFLAGTSFRAIARELQVNHQTVANWIAAYEVEAAGE